MKYSYEIARAEFEGSDGWQLRLIENTATVAEVRFAIDNYSDTNDALRSAYLDAEVEAKDWLNSRQMMGVHHSRPIVILGLTSLPIIFAALLFVLLVPTISDFFGEILHLK